MALISLIINATVEITEDTEEERGVDREWSASRMTGYNGPVLSIINCKELDMQFV